MLPKLLIDSLKQAGCSRVDIHDTGDSIHDIGDSRMTPLGKAIWRSGEDHGTSLSIVKALLRAGCSSNSIVRWGHDRELVGRSTLPYVNQTALLSAIETKRKDLVQLLLDEGAKVNEPAKWAVKRTPLQKAAEVGSLEIVMLLLDHGADVNAKPAFSRGGTALQFAAISGNCNIAAELLTRGAELHVPPSIHGRWPLEGAA